MLNKLFTRQITDKLQSYEDTSHYPLIELWQVHFL